MEELGDIQEQNNRAGTQTLSEMPSFAEHMAEIQEHEKTFEEARSEGNLPEGIRDEQDYKEYLAEQKARNNETAEHDRALFSKIESIEDPYDRSFITAALGLSHKNGSHNTIVPFCMDFIEQDEFSDIGDFLKSKRAEFSDANALTISQSAGVLSQLKTGATIEKEAASIMEGLRVLHDDKVYYEDALNNFCDQNEIRASFICFPELQEHKEVNFNSGVAATIAKNIMRDYDENASAVEKNKNARMLEILAQLYNGHKDECRRVVERGIGQLGRTLSDKVIAGDIPDHLWWKAPCFTVGDVIDIVAANEVSEKISSAERSHGFYSKVKSLGNEILKQRNN